MHCPFGKKKVARNSLLLLLMLLLLPQLFQIEPVRANHPSVPSYDAYRGNWFGIRPNAPREAFIYDEMVYEVATSPDHEIDMGLSANMFDLKIDELIDANTGKRADVLLVRVSAIVNSRLDLYYTLETDPLRFPQSTKFDVFSTGTICSQGTDLGIRSDDEVKLVGLQRVYFFGSSATSSGAYDQMWVSSNGFISFIHDTAAPVPTNALQAPPNGVVAPFWRDLTLDGSSSVRLYADSSNLRTYVAWCNMVTKANGNRATFMAVFHFAAQDTGRNSALQFVYGSVTPSDGVPTLVGIDDEHGVRPQLYSASTLVVSGRTIMFHVHEEQEPQYMDTFTITVDDGGDPDASMIFQAPVSGFHIMTGPNKPVEIIPSLAKDIITHALAANRVYGYAAGDKESPLLKVGSLTGKIVGNGLYVIKTMEDVLNLYSEVIDPFLQVAADTSDKSQLIFKTGMLDGGFTATDAFMGLAFFWRLHDTCRCSTHRITITSKVNYSTQAFFRATRDTSGPSSFQTSVTIELRPGTSIERNGFEQLGQTPAGWVAGDVNPDSGHDYWGSVRLCNTRCYAGEQVLWNSGSGGQTPLTSYDNNMVGFLQTYTPSFAGFSNLYLYFKAWIDTEDNWDSFSIYYWSGSSWLTLLSPISGRISAEGIRSGGGQTSQTAGRAGWLGFRLDLPSNTQGIRFAFYSGGNIAYEGVYLDEVYIMGTSTNVHDVTVKGVLAGTDAPVYGTLVSLDGSTTKYPLPVIFSTSQGSHTLQVEECLQIGPRVKWTTQSSISLNVQSDTEVRVTYTESSGNCNGEARQFMRPDGDLSPSEWTAVGVAGTKYSAVDDLVLKNLPITPGTADYIEAVVGPTSPVKVQRFSLSDLGGGSTEYKLTIWVYLEIISPDTTGGPMVTVKILDGTTGETLHGFSLGGSRTPAWYTSGPSATAFPASTINSAILEIRVSDYLIDPTARIYAIYVEDPPGTDTPPPPKKCSPPPCKI